jgi:hypothetical protein
VHRVLKNFPAESELRALAAARHGADVSYRTWGHYWALAYRVAQR